MDLTESAAIEIRALDYWKSPDDILEVTQFLTLYDLLTGRYSRCKSQISKAIRAQPWNFSLWKWCSNVLVYLKSISLGLSDEPIGVPSAELLVTVCRTAEQLKSFTTHGSALSPLSLSQIESEMPFALLAKGMPDLNGQDRKQARSSALLAIRMNPCNFANWTSLCLVELSGCILGDMTKSTNLKRVLNSMSLISRSDNEARSLCQEEFVSRVAQEIDTRCFSTINGSEASLYRQGNFADLIRYKKVALALHHCRSRLEVCVVSQLYQFFRINDGPGIGALL